METLNITDVLGGEKVIRRKIETRMDLIELGNIGLPKDALISLSNYLSLPVEQMAQIIPQTGRSLHRLSLQKHFNRVVSEQILKIAEVVTRGYQVFEQKDNFISWINQSNKAFGGRTPLSLLSSRFGMEMVLDELGRIDYGIIS